MLAKEVDGWVRSIPAGDGAGVEGHVEGGVVGGPGSLYDGELDLHTIISGLSSRCNAFALFRSGSHFHLVEPYQPTLFRPENPLHPDSRRPSPFESLERSRTTDQ